MTSMCQRPTFAVEEELWQTGYRHIAGIDEVGRGSLAGPVVAAAVILSSERSPLWLSQVRDSKKLTPHKRDFLSRCIQREAMAFGLGVVLPEVIDDLGIVHATRIAMHIATQELAISPDCLIIDAVALPESAVPQRSIIKGDNISLSIAAASIVAKVHRDKIMVDYDSLYPQYGFADNKGYPTAAHLMSLRDFGECLIHRTSFAPVRRLLENNGR